MNLGSTTAAIAVTILRTLFARRPRRRRRSCITIASLSGSKRIPCAYTHVHVHTRTDVSQSRVLQQAKVGTDGSAPNPDDANASIASGSVVSSTPPVVPTGCVEDAGAVATPNVEAKRDDSLILSDGLAEGPPPPLPLGSKPLPTAILPTLALQLSMPPRALAASTTITATTEVRAIHTHRSMSTA